MGPSAWEPREGRGRGGRGHGERVGGCEGGGGADRCVYVPLVCPLETRPGAHNIDLGVGGGETKVEGTGGRGGGRGEYVLV